MEELGITLCHVSDFALEIIGRCCPLLKSLEFKSPYCHGYEAYVIARTMPELRHLQLVGSELTNDGLLAILNGCPRLESLDLRRCSEVNLEGSLGRRCAEQIKDLKHPESPIGDYRFGYALCYETIYDDCCYEYIFRVRDQHKHQAVPFDEGVNQAEIENKNIAQQDELSESLGVESEDTNWEEIDAIWEIEKNQRSRKGKKNANSKGFRRSRRGKKNIKGKKYGRKAGKINHKSICFEQELW